MEVRSERTGSVSSSVWVRCLSERRSMKDPKEGEMDEDQAERDERSASSFLTPKESNELDVPSIISLEGRIWVSYASDLL